MKTNIFTLVLVLLVIIFAGIYFGSLPWTPSRIAGVVIGLPSVVLLVLARIELGGSFSVRPRAQTLVTCGLYSRIRNPIYLFGGLAIAGAFSISINRSICGSSFSFRCRSIEHARRARSSRQDSVTSTGNTNRASGSDKLHGFRECLADFAGTCSRVQVLRVGQLLKPR